MERLKIGIDLDGVICDSAPLIIPKIYSRFRPGYQPAKKERFGFDLGGHIDELKASQEEILQYVAEKIWADEQSYQKIRPVDGAVEGIQTLYNQGHRLYVLSNRPETVDLGIEIDVRDLTFSWLNRHQIGPLVISLILNPNHFDRDFKVRRAIELELDVFVEDEADEAAKFIEVGKKVVFFDREGAHFTAHPDIVIARSWSEIAAAIDNLSFCS